MVQASRKHKLMFKKMNAVVPLKLKDVFFKKSHSGLKENH